MTRPSHYFITGATGALGRELLPRVLREDPRARITLLVRAVDAEEANNRLQYVLRYLRTFRFTEGLDRIEAVPGDLVRDGLGLSVCDRTRLENEVTHIIHSAATIKLNEDHDEAWRVNVEGTQRMLDLAGACRRLRTFTHISTAYVAGVRNGLILEDDLQDDHGFKNAYERCKLEAERRVRRAMADLPIIVFRPSIIVGDSRDGHLSALSGIYPPLEYIQASRPSVVPGDGSVPLDLVPVDYVADTVVELTLWPRRFGATYHVVAGRHGEISARELVQRFLATLGVPSDRPVSFSTALRRRIEKATGPDGAGEKEAAHLRAFFTYLSGAKSFDDSNLRRDLGPAHVPAPDIRDYLPVLIDYCHATDWGRVSPWEMNLSPSAPA